MIFPPGLELKSLHLWADKQIIVSGDLIKDNAVDFVELEEKINLPDSQFFLDISRLRVLFYPFLKPPCLFSTLGGA